jgi:diacylglycerol kinase family enzyme
MLNTGRTERIDTMAVNGRFAIGTIGLGFDAHIAHLFSKAGSRGYSTNVKLVLTEFYKYEPKTFNILAGDASVIREAFLLTFANSSQFGNNALIAPFADVKDGMMDITIMKKFPAITAPWLIYRMMNNSLHRSGYFTGWRSRDVLIQNDTLLPGHIDGEPVEFNSDIKIEIRPLSLSVIVPS